MLSISLGAKAGLAWDHTMLGAKNKKMSARAGIELCRNRFISSFLHRIIESNVPGFAILRSISAYGDFRFWILDFGFWIIRAYHLLIL
jgi:hypothetical protein